MDVNEDIFYKKIAKHERWLKRLNKEKNICSCMNCYIHGFESSLPQDKNLIECKLQNLFGEQLNIILGFDNENLKYPLDDWATNFGNVIYSLDKLSNKDEVMLRWIQYTNNLKYNPMRDQYQLEHEDLVSNSIYS